MSINLEGLISDDQINKPAPKAQSNPLLAGIKTFKPGETIKPKKKIKSNAGKSETILTGPAKKKVERWLEQIGHKRNEIEWELTHCGLYVEYLRKQALNEKMMLYSVRHHNEIHLFRSKRSATEYSEWAERDIEIHRTEEYLWNVRPGMVLIAHDLTHNQLVIQPDGSVLVRLRPRRNVESVMPMRYTTDEIISLRDRFKDTFKPNLHTLARNPDLVSYVLDALQIQRSVREEQKFLHVLQNVFNMDEFGSMGSNISDVEPLESYVVSHGGQRLRKKSRFMRNEQLVVKVAGPERRKPIESMANLMFVDFPEIEFPSGIAQALSEWNETTVVCKAQWNFIKGE